VVRRNEAPLASQPTLSRLENTVGWESIRRLELEGAEWFCRHVARPTAQEIVLDIDSTEDPTHGQQQLAFYSGFYGGYMYHPILVFEGESGVLLGSRLRPGDVGGTRGLLALLRPLVSKLRRRFARSAIALRGDGDFAKPNLLDFAEYACCLRLRNAEKSCVGEAC